MQGIEYKKTVTAFAITGGTSKMGIFNSVATIITKKRKKVKFYENKAD